MLQIPEAAAAWRELKSADWNADWFSGFCGVDLEVLFCMKLSVVGSGDAFGSGGRFQTCFHLSAGDWAGLIDCGATTLIGMSRMRLDPNAVSVIFISHLHGDHFSGLVWWMLHARHVAKRRAPLTIVGPVGTAERYRAATEALFPGSSEKELSFELSFVEHDEAGPFEIGPAKVAVVPVSHPSGAPSYALRLAVADKVIGYCFSFDQAVRYHMSWQDISSRLDLITSRRVLLTHMSEEMLARIDEVRDARVMVARDGLVLEI